MNTESCNQLPRQRLQAALQKAKDTLLAWRKAAGYWEGYLSSSALATATALSAFALARAPQDEERIAQARRWLAETQTADGGWGDTPESPSNLATTLLVAAAAQLVSEQAPLPATTKARLEGYLAAQGAADPQARVTAILRAYGDDRTFSVPILMNCALAGLVDWRDVPPLPYTLAVLPRLFYRLLRLRVVSYALPALIAVGLTIAEHQRVGGEASRCRRLLHNLLWQRLARLQPASGGFLEAAPLTAFVSMSLLSLGRRQDPVVQEGLQFLRHTMRPDGSLPIDSNLSVWLTSLSLQALEAAGGIEEALLRQTRDWLAARQYHARHPFTGAAPGGWGWSHLPGAVPDADDTSAALLALADHLAPEACAAGVRWLLDLQNADGGWPTFCRGWGQLPFDRSCPDITAHALRALIRCRERVPQLRHRIHHALRKGLIFLEREQAAEGAWTPLWFGNQAAPEQANPVLGTARVLMALALLAPNSEAARRGQAYLRAAQNTDGGWGGAPGVSSTTEEAALTVSALSLWPQENRVALQRGVLWLVARVESDEWQRPSPIGLYFARLWYAEALYPIIWTTEALGRVARIFSDIGD